MPFQKGHKGYWFGKKRSEETRKKMSEAQKGEKNYFFNKHYKGKNHPRYGKHHSKETKRKISIAHKGKRLSKETRRKMRGRIPWNKDKRGVYSKETIIKMSKKHPDAIGSKNYNWKGGKIGDGHGYMLIYSPQHPFKSVGKYVYEHRLVMEKHLGRYLKTPEIVHHINKDTFNNKISNLMLFPNHYTHLAFHRKLNAHNKP